MYVRTYVRTYVRACMYAYKCTVYNFGHRWKRATVYKWPSLGATFAEQPNKTIVFVTPGIADDKKSENIACVAFGKR